MLRRNAVQLAAADHRYARLKLQEPAADADDELPPLNDDDDIEDEDVTAEADQPIVAAGNQEVSSLCVNLNMGTGRQAKDPTSSVTVQTDMGQLLTINMGSIENVHNMPNQR